MNEKPPKVRRSPPKPAAPPPPPAAPVVRRERFGYATNLHWGYPFSVAGDGPEADRLRAFFAGFTSQPPLFEGYGYLVLAPDDLDRAVKAFEKNIPVLFYADVFAAAGLEAPADERFARLARVLATPGNLPRAELEMLLASWPADQDPARARRLAAEAVEAWPPFFRWSTPRIEAAVARGEVEVHRRWVCTGGGEAVEAARARGELDPLCVFSIEAPKTDVARVEGIEHARDLSIRGVPSAGQWADLGALARVEVLAVGDYTSTYPTGLDPALWFRRALGAKLRALSTYGMTLGAADLAVLARREGTLRHLHFEAAHLTGAPAGAALAEVAARHPLRALELPYNDLGPAGTAALFARPVFGQLEVLNLSANEIGDEGGLALARNDSLGNLRWLTIRSNANHGVLTKDFALALAAASLPRLGSLFLSGQDLGSEGAAALLGAPGLGALHTLNLNRCGASWAEVIALLGGRGLPALTRLDASNWSLKRKPRWRDAAFLATVKHLRAEGIPGGAFEALLGSGCLPRLESLVLCGVYAQHPKAVAALQSAPALPTLKVLSLHGWKIDEAEARSLVAAPLVASLEALDLTVSSVGPKAARVFLEHGIRVVGSPLFDEYVANDVRMYPFHHEWLIPEE